MKLQENIKKGYSKLKNTILNEMENNTEKLIEQNTRKIKKKSKTRNQLIEEAKKEKEENKRLNREFLKIQRQVSYLQTKLLKFGKMQTLMKTTQWINLPETLENLEFIAFKKVTINKKIYIIVPEHYKFEEIDSNLMEIKRSDKELLQENKYNVWEDK